MLQIVVLPEQVAPLTPTTKLGYTKFLYIGHLIHRHLKPVFITVNNRTHK